jgi:hypothetical protein
VGRILKARYIFRISIHDSCLGYNPSYFWRSIWNAKQVLICGCRRVIGDGRKVDATKDLWLTDKWVLSQQSVVVK